MDSSLQLDTEQVLKLLELGIESSEKGRSKDFQNIDTSPSSSSSGQSSFLHDVYSTQANQQNLVLGSSVGIAKIISAHLNSKEKFEATQKEICYSKQNGDAFTKQNGDTFVRQNGDAFTTKQNGDAFTQQNGDLYTKHNGISYTKHNDYSYNKQNEDSRTKQTDEVIKSKYNSGLDKNTEHNISKTSDGVFSKGSVTELQETDLLIQQLKEKIQDVNLISDDIKRRLDGQNSTDNGSINRNGYHHTNGSLNTNGPLKTSSTVYSINGSNNTNDSINTNWTKQTNEPSNMIRLKNSTGTYQRNGSSNMIGASNKIEAENKTGLLKNDGDVNDDGENEDEDKLDPDQLKAIMTRLLAEKQRLISQAEEDQKSKPGFISQQTYEERQLSRASESSEEEQSIKASESSEERRPLISPKPNDIRRHLASPTHFEEGKQLFKMSDMTRNYCSPTPRSLSEFTKENSQQMKPRPDQLPRKLSIDESNFSSNELLKNPPNQLRTRSNSVFATTSGQHALDETNSSDDDKKKNPAIRKLVYSQYREMLRGYSKSSQKNNI